MKEPLDLSHVRPQVCPLCHNRGSYPTDRDRARTICHCPAGLAIRSTDAARERLASVYSSRDTTLWLESRIGALGGERPIQLLRDGRANEVMAVIEKIPGIPPREPEEPEVPEEARVSEHREPLPGEIDQLRRVILSKLQQAGYRKIADAFGRGFTADLDDREQAILDSVLTGTGYLIDGRRVDPLDVEVIRWS